jgi:hypothetical protein
MAQWSSWEKKRHPDNPVVFMDLEIQGHNVGRIYLEVKASMKFIDRHPSSLGKMPAVLDAQQAKKQAKNTTSSTRFCRSKDLSTHACSQADTHMSRSCMPTCVQRPLRISGSSSQGNTGQKPFFLRLAAYIHTTFLRSLNPTCDMICFRIFP